MNLIKFFDEINALEYERKQERIDTAQKIEKELVIFFNGIYADILNGIFLYTKPSTEYIYELYITLSDISDSSLNDSELKIHLYDAAKEIVQTTIDAYLEPSGTEFELARNKGAPMKESIIPDEIIDTLGRTRIQKIAANEALYIVNYKEFSEALTQGKKSKIWNTMEDERVRYTHAIVDKEEIPINEPFYVGGYQMMFPGDTSMGADISETILCRCWLTYK